MRRRLERTLLLLTLIFVSGFLCVDSLFSIKIRITGKWTLRIDDKDLIGGAGSDFAAEWESAINEISIAITKTTAGGTGPWRVDIHRINSNWNSNIHLYAKRTSEGIGDGTITGGTAYQEITEVTQYFFDGSADRSKIEIQLKATNISVQMGMDDFITTLYYTITDL